MKKTLLLPLASALSISMYAQQSMPVKSEHTDFRKMAATVDLTGAKSTKTTALGDTLYFYSNKLEQEKTGANVHNLLIADQMNPRDSGYFYGTNAWERKAYAELYPYGWIDQTGADDTTYNIIGVVMKFGGRVQPNSTKTINVNVWKRATGTAGKVPINNLPKWYIYGYPTGTPIATKSISINNIFPASNQSDRVLTYFTNPAVAVAEDVYVGFSMNYTWSSMGGDSIGLYSTTNAPNFIRTVETSTKDTLAHFFNVYQDKNGNWNNYMANTPVTISNAGDLVIYPVIRLNCSNCWPTNIGGISKENLTFFGNYPNPAVNNTNIKFSLKESADVTIEIMDVAGRVIQTIAKKGMSAGINVVNVETANLAAGNYVYTLSSSNGGTVASQFSVAK